TGQNMGGACDRLGSRGVSNYHHLQVLEAARQALRFRERSDRIAAKHDERPDVARLDLVRERYTRPLAPPTTKVRPRRRHWRTFDRSTRGSPVGALKEVRLKPATAWTFEGAGDDVESP